MSDVIVAGVVGGAIAGTIIGAAVLLGAFILSRRPSAAQPRGWELRTSSRSYGRTESAAPPGTSSSARPFDRFNDRAKRVLALAQDEAVRFNHNYIGTEHLLLGLVREGEGLAARILDSLGVEISKLRTAVEFIIGRGDATTSSSEITLSPRTKRVIELAVAEAERREQSHVGTEHLLLGLVIEGEGMASGILESIGVSLEMVRARLAATLGDQGTRAARPQRGPFDRFDSRSKRVLALAQDEAVRVGHAYIGTEHLMLGLLRCEGRTHDVLTALGVGLDAARAAVIAVVPRGTGEAPSEITLSPRVHALLGRAVGISRERNDADITPVVLLLALIDDADGIGAHVLSELGATAEKVRAALAEPPPSNLSASS